MLGLMNNFVNTANKTKTAFKYMQTKFPRIGEAKIKEGTIFSRDS